MTVTSFLGAEVYSYAPLVMAFFPIMAYSRAIAGAEERGALDMLLGTPMRRRHIVLATWLSVSSLLLGVLFATGLISWLASLAVDAHLSLGSAMSGALGVFPIALAFGSLALLFSAMMRQRGTVIGAAFGVMFLMYLIDIVGKVASDYRWVEWASAFRFYGSPIVNGISWGNVAVLLASSIVLLAVTMSVFDGKDIYT